MVKPRKTARQKLDRLLRKELTEIRKHNFKKAMHLIDRQNKILVKLQRHKVQVRKHGRGR